MIGEGLRDVHVVRHVDEANAIAWEKYVIDVLHTLLEGFDGAFVHRQTVQREEESKQKRLNAK
jgi:hypothetical protein